MVRSMSSPSEASSGCDDERVDRHGASGADAATTEGIERHSRLLTLARSAYRQRPTGLDPTLEPAISRCESARYCLPALAERVDGGEALAALPAARSIGPQVVQPVVQRR